VCALDSNHRAADAAPLQHQDVAVRIRLAACVLIDALEHRVERLGEVRRRHVRARLDDHDREAATGELVGHDAAAATRTHDDDVRFEAHLGPLGR
jgi:hypothetical protein